MDTGFQIAIDGPVAAGKSTVARELAKKTSFIYIDTGAMYRAIALKALGKQVDLEKEEKIVEMLRSTEIDVRPPEGQENDGRLSTVLLDSNDVSWEIRTPEVNSVVAKVASLPRVREVLVPMQRKIAVGREVVMEGRDITYVVLPDADLKIFLTASEEVRVSRYFEMLQSRDESVSREYAEKLLRERDELDRTREASPLRVVKDAWVLDTSTLSIMQVVDIVAKKVEQMKKNIV